MSTNSRLHHSTNCTVMSCAVARIALWSGLHSPAMGGQLYVVLETSTLDGSGVKQDKAESVDASPCGMFPFRFLVYLHNSRINTELKGRSGLEELCRMLE